MRKQIIKIVTCFTLALSIVISKPIARAQGAELYYVNKNGITFTKEQYEKAVRLFGEDFVPSLTQDLANEIKNDKNMFISEKKVIYVQTDSYYDRNGNLLGSWDKRITEKVANQISTKKRSEVSTYGNVGQPTHETTAKKLEMWVVNSGEKKTVTIRVTWKKGHMPKVKSYDVIAMRPESQCISFNMYNVYGYQKSDNDLIEYSDS